MEQGGDQPESYEAETERCVPKSQGRIQAQGETYVGGDHHELGARAKEDLALVPRDEREVVGPLQNRDDAQRTGEHAPEDEDASDRGASSVNIHDVSLGDRGVLPGWAAHAACRDSRVRRWARPSTRDQVHAEELGNPEQPRWTCHPIGEGMKRLALPDEAWRGERERHLLTLDTEPCPASRYDVPHPVRA